MAPAPAYLTYARQVTAGKILASKWVRLACERHLRDLKDGKVRGLRFDPAAAAHAIDFFRFLKHSKGEWAGTEFHLEPWQQFIVGSSFGWLRADGLRRYRTIYIEIPRKNGKSTIVAGMGLYLFFGDGEPGAEVYAAATKKDQAKIVFSEAKRMVQASPSLKKRIGVNVGNLHILGTASKFEPLGADEDTMDGLNVHGAIVDEVHAHKNRGIWDVLETASGSRRQPMRLAITTAGFDRHSICWELHEYGQKVNEGILEDDSFFSYVACIDEDDDWTDEAIWAKANPNLGVSVKLDDLRALARKAKAMPAAQNSFRRLRLDQWTEQESRWLDLATWDACGVAASASSLEGRPCYGGLDLASTTDICALELYFPPEEDEEVGVVLSFFWVPAENILQRAKKDRVPYDTWVRSGHIKATDGNIVDYDVIFDDIRELSQTYDIQELAYDRWNATQLTTQLASEGITVVPIGQGFQGMAGPTRELEKLVVGKRLDHGGNPVLRWMASNVAVKQDPAGNFKPDKSKSRERIDGIVALAMAVGRAQVNPDAGGSKYETEEVFTYG